MATEKQVSEHQGFYFYRHDRLIIEKMNMVAIGRVVLG